MRSIQCSARIKIEGVVQGVGFRPYIHRLAEKYGLGGYVSNTSTGVLILVEGSPEEVWCFYKEIGTSPPPLAQIQKKTIQYCTPLGLTTFEVRESLIQEQNFVLLPPDIGICADCLRELFNPSDRRYLYPFINCTNCGPRFTIIEDIPYDRVRTSMKHFRMCSDCKREYEDITDRRYHAQPNACWECGPRLQLVGRSDFERGGRTLATEKRAVELAIEALTNGGIVAIKGIGGFHVACDATNDQAVATLKHRKKREMDKPLAVMMPTIATVEKHCALTGDERTFLDSPQKPIVLLEWLERSTISRRVAPRNRYLGVMLPYTPLHHILFHKAAYEALVMTSANTSEEPIVIDNEEALDQLLSIADFILLHDRQILHRCDDSVGRVVGGRPSFIRRSRGYTPYPIVMDFQLERLLACGAELKNTFCLTERNCAFLSQHIGDLKNWETFQHFQESIEHFKRQFRLEPELVACDLHPDYLSTSYARDYHRRHLGEEHGRLFEVQHHHAHIASCMAENGLVEKVIGVAFDGTGYGEDGRIWGGEFLVCDYRDCTRVGHLKYVAMPGSDAAIREPWRMAFSYLFQAYGREFLNWNLPFLRKLETGMCEILLKMLEGGVNCPETSSCGRLFDAISALSLSLLRNNYEGQAAAELEMSIRDEGGERYDFIIEDRDNVTLVDCIVTVKDVVEDVRQQVSPSVIARKFHNTVAHFTAEVCEVIARKTGIDKVALSGGCFQNRYLTGKVVSILEGRGFRCYLHSKVPPNDGGISLGQALIASERRRYVRRSSMQANKG